jgi:hypothetical protein
MVVGVVAVVRELPIAKGRERTLRGAGKTEGSPQAAQLPFPRVCDVGLAAEAGIGLQEEDDLGAEAAEGGEEGGEDPFEEDLLAAVGDSSGAGGASRSGAGGASSSGAGGASSSGAGGASSSGAGGASSSKRSTVAEALKAARGARPLDGRWGAAWVLQVAPGADHIVLPPHKLAGQTRTYEKIFPLARHTPSGIFVEAAALDGGFTYFYLSLDQISKNGITAPQPLGTMLPLKR